MKLSTAGEGLRKVSDRAFNVNVCSMGRRLKAVNAVRTPRQHCRLVTTGRRLVRQQECKLLELEANWADLHHPDSQAPAEKTLPGAEQGRQLGGDGNPEVLEFCVAELGTSIETNYGSARALMADALDLRHRLPELWQLIMAGSVQAWKARKVAQATRHLSRSSAMHVDATVAPSIAGLPWARFETLLAAKIIEADPRAAEEQAKDLGGRTVRPGWPHQSKRSEALDRESQRRRCHLVHGDREPDRGDLAAAR
jgi:hypothetical protein